MVRRPTWEHPRTVGRWHDGANMLYMIGPVASCCDPSSVFEFRRFLSEISTVPRLTMIVALCRYDPELSSPGGLAMGGSAYPFDR